MNKSWYSRKVLWIIFFLSFLQSAGTSQSVKEFNSENLFDVIDYIESQSELVFNFDPDLIGEFRFTGQIDLRDRDTMLPGLFFNFPIEYRLVDNTVILFSSKPGKYTFCGTVRDKESKAGIPYVNIFLATMNQGVYSEDDGGFEWTFDAYKNQKISISHIGYKELEIPVVEINQDDCLDIYLELDEGLFSEEIIVKSYILDGISEGQEYSSLDLDYGLLLDRSTFLEGDVLKSIQLLPGISSSDESASNLNIRGSTPDQNLIIWEDAVLYEPGHVFGMISALNPFVIGEVNVYKGVFNSKYDNRVGGVVDISLTDSVTDKIHGGFGTTLSEAHGYIEFPLIENKLSVLAAGRKTINALFDSPTLVRYTSKVFQNSKIDDEKEEVELGDLAAQQNLDYYDINSKLIYNPHSSVSLEASYFKSKNDFSYSTQLIDDRLYTNDILSYNSSAFHGAVRLKYNERGEIRAGYSYSDYDNNYGNSIIEFGDELVEENNITNGISDQTLYLENEWQINQEFNATVGVNRNKKKVGFSFLSMNDFEPELEDVSNITADFWNTYSNFKFNNKSLSIDGGIKLIRFDQANSLVISPRLNAQFALSPFFKLKVATGIFQQYISQLKDFGDNDLGLNTNVWIIDNEELDNTFIESKKISAGVIFQRKGWMVDMEAYYNKIEGLTTLASFLQSGIELEDDFYYGNASSRGIDVLVKKSFPLNTSWIKYSLSKGAYIFDDIEEDPFPASNDQMHTFSILNNWRFKDLTFLASYHYKTGLPFSEPSYIDQPEDDDYYFLVYEDLNQSRLKDYHRIDLGISYHPEIKRLPFQIELSCSVINVLNNTNTFSREFYLADLDDTDGIPEWYEIEKQLLQRTLLMSFRAFW
ncbi:MAG: TonB-dependent receptor [Saprospiraceae bacterium]|nr:TonB-dependent receptor [Saprospiraceae bacterium]